MSGVGIHALRGPESCVSRKPPFRLMWVARDCWCAKCGNRWEECFPFKSARQLNSYRPRCPKCAPSYP